VTCHPYTEFMNGGSTNRRTLDQRSFVENTRPTLNRRNPNQQPAVYMRLDQSSYGGLGGGRPPRTSCARMYEHST